MDWIIVFILLVTITSLFFIIAWFLLKVIDFLTDDYEDEDEDEGDFED
jgi:hypothetical protein